MADLLTGWKTLFQPYNRVKGNNAEDAQGVTGDLLPELDLNIEDAELIKLKNNWLNHWTDFNKTLSKKQETNENYWKGKFTYSELEQQSADRPEADNLIFEAVETSLPQITRQNPEASIDCDNEDQKKLVQDELKYLADTLKFKLKLREVTRYWMLGYFGIGIVEYDVKNNRINFRGLRPQKCILDPDGHVEGGMYIGEYFGYYKTEKASTMIKKFPKAMENIKALVKGNEATKITYIEWWTDEYCFWTVENTILDKIKNPHWDYGTDKEQTNQFGQVVKVPQEPKNHLPYPQKPVAMLTVFNNGKGPVDETGLVEQNLYIQDLIHKRLKQLDVNIDNINGGYIFTGKSGLNKEQANEALNAIRKGGGIYIPEGSAGDAYAKVNGEGLSGDVYNSLQDYRTELRNIFGVRGSSAQGLANEQTVRGKILIGQKDSDRISLIAEYLEQFTDYVYNWFVQMMMVYYPEEFTRQLTDRMLITVKEGSLIPKDSLTKRNEAIDLWSAGALSLKDLYKSLEMPNIDEMLANFEQWKLFNMAPNQVDMVGNSQETMQQQQMMAQQQMQQPQGPMPDQQQMQNIIQQVPQQ